MGNTPRKRVKRGKRGSNLPLQHGSLPKRLVDVRASLQEIKSPMIHKSPNELLFSKSCVRAFLSKSACVTEERQL